MNKNEEYVIDAVTLMTKSYEHIDKNEHRCQITIGGRPVDAESMEKFSESVKW